MLHGFCQHAEKAVNAKKHRGLARYRYYAHHLGRMGYYGQMAADQGHKSGTGRLAGGTACDHTQRVPPFMSADLHFATSSAK